MTDVPNIAHFPERRRRPRQRRPRPPTYALAVGRADGSASAVAFAVPAAELIPLHRNGDGAAPQVSASAGAAPATNGGAAEAKPQQNGAEGVDDVREFLTVVTAQATAALKGFHDPGVLQLCRLHPTKDDDEDEELVPTRYRIDDVERMIHVAMGDCAAGHNVYVEIRTVRADLTGRRRGSLDDTRWVFALVVDSDGDTGKGWVPTLTPSMTVETSPGNSQYWYFLEIAVDAKTGRDLGKRLKQTAKADFNTGVVTQPYAGTTNYPNAKKIARGRVITPTRLIDCQPDRVYSVEALEAAFPPLTSPKKESTESKTSSGDGADHGGGYVKGDMSPALLDLVRDGVPDSEDRSKVFHGVIGKLKRDGWSLDAIVELLQEYPDGIARKYCGRIAYAAELSYGKIEIPAPEPAQSLGLIWHGDPVNDQAASWLVHEMLPKTGVALISGQWGTYKSFIAFDLVLSIIFKALFAGRTVTEQGGVLWLAAEAQSQIPICLKGVIIDKGAAQWPHRGCVRAAQRGV
jgi:hypothetical protein